MENSVENLEHLKKEVNSLNLKDNKDYLRFNEIRNYFKKLYKDKTPEYDFISEKERKSFKNYPFFGFEFYESFEEHYNKYYLGVVFENFEQEQYMYNDLMLQYRRRLVFNKEGDE